MSKRLSCSTMIAGSLVAAWLSGPPATQAADQADPSEPVAIVAGEPVTAEQVTSFGLLLRNTERRGPEGPQADLEDFIITRLHGDVYTTVPVASEPQDQTSPSLNYPAMAQRALLRERLQGKIESQIGADQSEYQAWYDQHVNEWIQPESMTAYHLFMQTSEEEPTSAPARVRQRMEQVKGEADAGTSFAVLARKYSEASSAEQGGLIGTVQRGRPFGAQGKPINPRLENALFQLEPGQVSGIVETSHGLHLLYAADYSTTVTPTLQDFITSGIVQRAVLGEKVPARRKALVEETIRRYGGRVVEPTTATADLTTATPAMEFAGRTITISDLEKIYGVPFTRAYTRARSNPEELKNLLRQVLEMEADIQAAIDLGVDKEPDTSASLQLLRQRADALERLQAIYASMGEEVTDEELRAEYEEVKELIRRPEAEGWVIVLSNPDVASTDTITRLRATDELKERSEKLAERAKAGEDFEQLIREATAADKRTTGGVVERHRLGAPGTDELTRAFDSVAGALTTEGDVVSQFGFNNSFVVAKLKERFPGEPDPFESIRPQLTRRALIERQKQVREDILRELEAQGKVRYLPAALRHGMGPSGAADKSTTSPAEAR